MKSKKFVLWTLAMSFSAFGDGFTSIAMSIMTYAITSSGKYASITFLLGLLPTVFFGPIVGVFVDRMSKKKILIYSNIFSIIILAFLFFAPSHHYFYFLGNFILSLISLFFWTSARIVIPLLFREDNLLIKINSAYSMTTKICRILGLTVAGYISDLVRFNYLFFIDMLSFIGCIMLIILIKELNNTSFIRYGSEERAKNDIKNEFIEGIKVYISEPCLIYALLLFSLITMCDGVILPQLVIFVEDFLKGSGENLGKLQSLFMAGTVVGQVIIIRYNLIKNEIKGLTYGVLYSSLCVIGMSAYRTILSSYIFFFLYGLFGALIMISWITLSQKLSKNYLLGRVTTIADAVVKVFNLLGIGASIILYDIISIPTQFMFIGFLSLSLLIIISTKYNNFRKIKL